MKPIIDKLGWDDVDHAKITMAEVVDYLNDVTQHYGPPCEWCKSFDLICEKEHLPKKYDMMFGPYPEFHFRRKCKDFTGIDDDGAAKSKESTRKMLDCFVQQYC